MKKVIFSLVMLVSFSVSFCNAEKKVSQSEIANVVSVMHDDTKGAISTIYDDGKGIITTLYGDGKELLSATYPDIKDAVIAIGKAIGVAAEHVYVVLVKQYVVIGIKELGIFIIGLVFAIVALIGFNRIHKKNEPIDWHILRPIIFLIIAIAFLTNVDYNAMLIGLLNPEYGAINYILDYSKTIIK